MAAVIRDRSISYSILIRGLPSEEKLYQPTQEDAPYFYRLLKIPMTSVPYSDLVDIGIADITVAVIGDPSTILTVENKTGKLIKRGVASYQAEQMLR